MTEMDVGKLGLRLTGRAKKDVTAMVVGDIELDDLNTLQTERGTKPPKIAKLRDRHHALARALAAGMGEGEAAILCRYSGSRVSILKNDPAFMELVAFYRKATDEKFYDMAERMAGLGSDAIDELTDRLEENSEDFTTSQLVDIATRMADRTGHGVSTKTDVNVKVGISQRLADARERANKVRFPQDESVIDITPNGSSNDE